MNNELIKALAPVPHWVCWRGDPVVNKTTGEVKTSKRPMYGVKDPAGNWALHFAKSNNPETWGTYDQAQEWMKVLKAEHKGIGFVLTLDGPGCIDLDNCLDSSNRKFKDTEVGKAASRVMEVLTRESSGTYAEVSPSGEGLHIWGRFALPPEKEKGLKKKNQQIEIEMYRAGRFITVTGETYTNTLVSMIQPAVDEIIKEFHLMDEGTKQPPISRTAAGMAPTMGDTALIEVIRKSKQREKFHFLYDLGEMGAYGNDQSAADQALVTMMAFYTKDPEQLKRLFLASALGQNISRKKHHEGDYLNRTIGKALAKVTDRYNPKAYAAMKKVEEQGQKNNVPSFSGGHGEPEQVGNNTPFLEMLRHFRKNDSENADRLAALCKGKFLYCTDLKTWLKYDGKKWRPVTPVELQEPARAAVKHTLAALARGYATFTEGGGTLDEDTQKKYTGILNYLNGKAQDNVCIQNSIRLAAGKSSIMCQAVDFDRDPLLLNCDNGVLDLKAGKLIPHSPAQRFMKCTRAAYDGKAHSTLWADTMREIVPDKETRDYVQRMAGYCLYGKIREQKLFFLFGRGGTGKGTFIETLGHALGDYATSIPVEILLSSRNGRDGNNATPEKAKLKGVRLALTSESGIDNSFDDGTLKLLTGGDEITARPLHSNPISFSPSHKLVGSSNYMPSIKDVTDDGIKRRLVIIPFHATFKRDNTLRPRLEEPDNLADCLLWAYEGYRKWQKQGLDDDTYSQEIAAANKTYYIENDFIGEFLDGSCDIGPDYRVDAHELYNRYMNFANGTGAPPLSRSKFTRVIKRRLNAIRLKSNGRVYIVGLKMKEIAEF